MTSFAFFYSTRLGAAAVGSWSGASTVHTHTHAGRVPPPPPLFFLWFYHFSHFMLGCFSLSPFLLLISSSSSSSSLPSPCLETLLGNKATRPFFFLLPFTEIPPFGTETKRISEMDYVESRQAVGYFFSSSKQQRTGGFGEATTLGLLFVVEVGWGGGAKTKAGQIDRKGFFIIKKTHTHNVTAERQEIRGWGVWFLLLLEEEGCGWPCWKNKKKKDLVGAVDDAGCGFVVGLCVGGACLWMGKGWMEYMHDSSDLFAFDLVLCVCEVFIVRVLWIVCCPECRVLLIVFWCREMGLQTG